MDLAERLERGELDHAEHPLLEQDRHHDDVHRRRLAETRADGDVAGRRVGDEDRLALDGRLPDEALADRERAGGAVARLVAVARDQAQARGRVVAVAGFGGRLGEEEGAVLS